MSWIDALKNKALKGPIRQGTGNVIVMLCKAFKG